MVHCNRSEAGLFLHPEVDYFPLISHCEVFDSLKTAVMFKFIKTRHILQYMLSLSCFA